MPHQPTSYANARRLPAPHDNIETIIAAANKPVVLLYTTDNCVPCTWIKPHLHRLACEHGDRFTFIEVHATETKLKAAHAVDVFPTLLFLRHGKVEHRHIGYQSGANTCAIVREFIGAPAPRTREADEFSHAIAAARRAMDAVMEPASIALAPHIQANAKAFQALDDAAERRLAEPGSNRAEILAQRHEAIARVNQPFANKIGALQAAQDRGIELFTRQSAAAVAAHAQRLRRDAQVLECDADGVFCRWIGRASEQG